MAYFTGVSNFKRKRGPDNFYDNRSLLAPAVGDKEPPIKFEEIPAARSNGFLSSDLIYKNLNTINNTYRANLFGGIYLVYSQDDGQLDQALVDDVLGIRFKYEYKNIVKGMVPYTIFFINKRNFAKSDIHYNQNLTAFASIPCVL